MLPPHGCLAPLENTAMTWQVIDAEGAALWLEYPFTKGAFATTLAFRGADGITVVSPASGLDAAAYDELASYGEVTALVANNGLHHLGQAAWRERFPAAESYAAPQILARLEKKSPGIPYRSIAELPVAAGSRAHVMDGCKNGETFFTVETKAGMLWYSGDVLTNIHRTPGPPISWLFRWTDSAPGFRLFRLGIWLLAKDKRALKAHLERLLAERPPDVIVPAHGPAISSADLAQQARGEIDKL
jgi:hypothetical protein